MPSLPQAFHVTGRLFRSPLSQRIILGIFVSLVAIEGIVLVPSVQRRRRELLAQIEDVSTGKVRWIVTAFPTASGVELADHLQQLKADPMLQGIVGGAVFNAQGEPVAQFGEPPTLAPGDRDAERQQLVTTTAGQRYDLAWTTTALGEGMIPDLTENHWLVLRHNADAMQWALIGYILRIAGLVLLIAAFITLVMMAFLSHQLITPILNLRRDLAMAGETLTADAATEAAPPEFASLAYPRQDELGEVIATFSQMYHQISQAISDRQQAEAQLRRHNAAMQQYIAQVDQITAAAAAVDQGTFQPASLDTVAQRSDHLGQLARMFQQMADHVVQREHQLKQQLKQLTIDIDQAKLQQQVTQITQSDYFQEIQAELETLQVDEFWP